MKRAEEYFNELNTAAIHPTMKKHIVSAIKLAQKDAYNEALEDALINGKCIDLIHTWNGSVSILEQSILKLKKI